MSTHYHSSVHSHKKKSVHDELKNFRKEQKEIKDLLAKLVMQEEHASSKQKSHHSSKHVSHHHSSSSKHVTHPPSTIHDGPYSSHNHYDYYQGPPRQHKPRHVDHTISKESKVDSSSLYTIYGEPYSSHNHYDCYQGPPRPQRPRHEIKRESMVDLSPSQSHREKEYSSKSHSKRKSSREEKDIIFQPKDNPTSTTTSIPKTINFENVDHASSQEKSSLYSSSIKEKEDGSKVKEKFYCKDESLLAKRHSRNQSCERNTSQQENNFYANAKVLEQTSSLIVNDSSKICNTRLESKEAFTTIPPPTSSKENCLVEKEDMVVIQHAKDEVSIRDYENKVLHNLVPMETCHTLLDRPWQLNKKILNGLTKEVSILCNDNTFVLQPLPLFQVKEDEIQMGLGKEMENELKRKFPSIENFNSIQTSSTTKVLTPNKFFETYELEVFVSGKDVLVNLLRGRQFIATLNVTSFGITPQIFNYDQWSYTLVQTFSPLEPHFSPKRLTSSNDLRSSSLRKFNILGIGHTYCSLCAREEDPNLSHGLDTSCSTYPNFDLKGSIKNFENTLNTSLKYNLRLCNTFGFIFRPPTSNELINRKCLNNFLAVFSFVTHRSLGRHIRYIRYVGSFFLGSQIIPLIKINNIVIRNLGSLKQFLLGNLGTLNVNKVDRDLFTLDICIECPNS